MKRLVAVLAAGLLGAGLGVSIPADAAITSPYEWNKAEVGGGNISFRSTPGFDAWGAMDARAVDAAQRWNQDTNMDRHLDYTQPYADNWNASVCREVFEKNGLHMKDTSQMFGVGGSNVGITVLCADSSNHENGQGYLAIQTGDLDPACGACYHLHDAQIVLDNQEFWYTGTSTNFAGTNFDSKSVLMHEFGHFLGMVGHFADPGSLCDSQPENDHVMCPIMPPGEYRRVLRPSDVSEILKLYPY